MWIYENSACYENGICYPKARTRYLAELIRTIFALRHFLTTMPAWGTLLSVWSNGKLEVK